MNARSIKNLISVLGMLSHRLVHSTYVTLPTQTISRLLKKTAHVSAVLTLKKGVLASRRLTSTTSQARKQPGPICKTIFPSASFSKTLSYPFYFLKEKDLNPVKPSRLTMHNVHFLLSLMKSARTAIINDAYPAFLRSYFAKLFNNDSSKYPAWAVKALRGVGVDLLP